MHATPSDVLEPSSLDSASLAARLAALAGDERAVQVEFLLHLDVFDRRRAWAEAGYPSLWNWCQHVLHLREGAAWRRIAAMRLLRRFPQLAGELRTGRLCLSTAALLGPVLTDANVGDVVKRAAFRSKAEVERLVAAVAPRPTPAEGVRKLPIRAAPASAPSSSDCDAPTASAAAGFTAGAPVPAVFDLGSADAGRPAAPAPAPDALPAPVRARPSVRPIDGETYAVRFNADAVFKAELDALRDLLAHKVPSGDLGTVLRVAVQCTIEKFGKRKGAVGPQRTGRKGRRPSPPPRREPGEETKMSRSERRRPTIPAEVRREVWRRDGGRCAWRGPDGHRCDSTWQLELDHLVPVALGGPSTAANLRVTCRAHNQLGAAQVFGHDAIARARTARRPLSLGEAMTACAGSEVATWVTE